MRVLITGASGFAGRHLSRLALSKKDTQVYGLVRAGSESKLVKGVEPVPGDLSDADTLKVALERVKPDLTFHLAGQANPSAAKEDPAGTIEVNVEGTRRLLDAAADLVPRARVLVAGSSSVYGASAQPGKKLTEQDRHGQPEDVYGRSKAEQEDVALEFHRKRQLDVVCIRAFNHTGPGQSLRYVATDYARDVAAIEKNPENAEIEIKNPENVRDFTDVRDVVEAYWLALQKGKPGEVYNVASGVGHRVEEIVQFYLRLSSVTIRTKRKTDPNAVPYIVGDAGKFIRATGWQARIPFETTLKDVFEDWRKRTNG